jgi:hypothetical protein
MVGTNYKTFLEALSLVNKFSLQKTHKQKTLKSNCGICAIPVVTGQKFLQLLLNFPTFQTLTFISICP